MQSILKSLLPLAVAFVISGCGSIAPENTPAGEYQQAEHEFGSAMLTAFRQEDYAAFSRDFSPELKESVSETAFQRLCSDLKARQESLTAWKQIDTLDRGGLYRTEIWKITLTRTNPRGQSHIERLFYVTHAALDGRTVVIGFKFDALF